MPEQNRPSRPENLNFSQILSFVSDGRGAYPTLEKIVALREVCEFIIAHSKEYEGCQKNRERLIHIEHLAFTIIGNPNPDAYCNCPECLELSDHVLREVERQRIANIRPERKSPKRQKTAIYLGTNRFGEFKIGQSLNIKFRERTLQSEDPEFRIVKFWNGKPSDEAVLHAKFQSKRKRGEWFALTSEEVSEIDQYFGEQS